MPRNKPGSSYVTDIDLVGVAEVQKALRAIPERLEKKVMRNATAKAMTPVAKRARINMRRISPTVAKALGKRTKQYRGGTTLTVVGIKTNTQPTVKREEKTLPDGTVIKTRRVHDPRNTAHLIEFGTKAHQIRIPWLNITASHPGTKPEQPIGKALESERNKVVNILKDNILNGVERITQREARRGNARR